MDGGNGIKTIVYNMKKDSTKRREKRKNRRKRTREREQNVEEIQQ